MLLIIETIQILGLGPDTTNHKQTTYYVCESVPSVLTHLACYHGVATVVDDSDRDYLIEYGEIIPDQEGDNPEDFEKWEDFWAQEEIEHDFNRGSKIVRYRLREANWYEITREIDWPIPVVHITGENEAEDLEDIGPDEMEGLDAFNVELAYRRVAQRSLV